MSNPAAPRVPESTTRRPEPGQTGVVSDPDVPNAFGPDAPNVRGDDPPAGPVTPVATPPLPPGGVLDGDDIAPDEAGAPG